MSYSLTIPLALGSSQTGLTLRANLYDAAGGAVGVNVTAGFVELGAGNYSWAGTIPDAFQGSVVFSDNGTAAVKAATTINPADDPKFLPAATGNLDTTTVVAGTWAALSASAAQTGLANQTALSTLNSTAAAINAKTTNLPSSPAAVGSAMTLAANQDVRNVSGTLPNVTVGGVANGAITDNAFTFPAETAGRPAQKPLAWLRRVGEWVTNKVVRDRATGLAKLYGADDTTVLETRQQSTTATGPTDPAGVDTQGRGA